MNDYKKENVFLGASDIARLTLVSWDKAGFLSFGKDGSYDAYVIDETIEIPGHYNLDQTFTSWLKIYDDERMTQEFRAKEIRVYKAGMCGCIIQLIN